MHLEPGCCQEATRSAGQWIVDLGGDSRRYSTFGSLRAAQSSSRHRESAYEVPVQSLLQRPTEIEMIKIIEDMPSGTIGLEAVGKVTEDDYRGVLLPAVSAAVERNDVRLLYILGEDFESYSPGAMWADTKLWAQHPKAWKRIAIVSDADWLEHSVKAFGWLIPGEIKVFDTDDVDDAKEWLVGLDEDDD
jgi:hypothetical protein